MKVRDAIKRLQTCYNEDDDVAMILWSAPDVEQVIEDYDLRRMTDDEIADVLNEVEDNHDANEGICWYTLSYFAEKIIEENDEVKK